MSGILLFCTDQVQAQVINQLMEDCTFPDPDLAYNIFSLVRTPDQPDIDKTNTSPPVEDFTTGFLGKSDAELRLFPRMRLPQMEHGQNINKGWVGILDKKSMSTQTVVLHYSYPKHLWDGTFPGAPVPANGEVFDQDGRIWWKQRVPFKHAWTFFNSLESDPTFDTVELYGKPELLKDGVLDMDTAYKILEGDMAEEDLG